MATTSIWAVKGRLGQVVSYAENHEKTENPKYQDDLKSVISYTSRDEKVQSNIRNFITGINCGAKTALGEMLATKKHYSKADGIVAFHGYQSFSKNEATPEIAHEIGVKLARRLWGESFQVMVTTHLDKDNLHNHFVVNNVSFKTGKKYTRTKEDYRKMQLESDKLCLEYGLSVIEKPESGRTKHYSEWRAEKFGGHTWRGMVKKDIDMVIRRSMTETQFWDNLKKSGYEFKVGKDISVRPEGKERFVRLRRNFGEDYTIETIRRRILAQTRAERCIIPPATPARRVKLRGKLSKHKRLTGLRALYFYYLYKIGVLPRKFKDKTKSSPKSVYFLFREDIRFIRRISEEARFLAKYGIDSVEQLEARKSELSEQIADKPNNIKVLRKGLKLCESIEKRSIEMKAKVQKYRKTKNNKSKELNKHEPRRRCRRASRPNEFRRS